MCRVKFGVKDAHGPETVLLDKAGRLHALCEDGWVREIREDGTTDRWAYVGGRPLGAAFDTVCVSTHVNRGHTHVCIGMRIYICTYITETDYIYVYIHIYKYIVQLYTFICILLCIHATFYLS